MTWENRGFSVNFEFCENLNNIRLVVFAIALYPHNNDDNASHIQVMWDLYPLSKLKQGFTITMLSLYISVREQKVKRNQSKSFKQILFKPILYPMQQWFGVIMTHSTSSQNLYSTNFQWCTNQFSLMGPYLSYLVYKRYRYLCIRERAVTVQVIGFKTCSSADPDSKLCSSAMVVNPIIYQSENGCRQSN